MKKPYVILLTVLWLSACSPEAHPTPENPSMVLTQTFVTEVSPNPSSSSIPTATATATATIEPSPTAVPLRFGLEAGMTVEDCNKLTLTADNKIPDEYLAQERAWIAANKPAFAEIAPFGYVKTLKYSTEYHFPLPVYEVFAGGRGSGSPGPEQFMVSCETLPDGTVIFDSLIKPYHDMVDAAGVTSENVPVFHFAYLQASYDWVSQHHDLYCQLNGCGAPGTTIQSPTEALAILTNPEKLSTLRILDIWVVTPSGQVNDLTLLDSSLQPLSNLISLNSEYENPNYPNFPGIVRASADLTPYLTNPDIDKIPLGERLSNIVLPVLAITFVY